MQDSEVELPNAPRGFADVFLDVLLVNKNNDLNVYKENELLLSAEGSDPKDQTMGKTPCCGPKDVQNLTRFNTSCDGTVRPSNLDDVDFNNWVGMFNRNRQRLGFS
jgi:hypothetical protein